MAKMYHATLDCGLLLGGDAGSVSPNRWGSMLQVMGLVCAGIMFHQLLPIVTLLTFTHFEDIVFS